MLNTPRLPHSGELGPIAETGRSPASSPDLRESARFTFRDGTYELLVNRDEVSGPRIKAWSQGEAEFALVAEGPLVLLCYRFGDMVPWSLAPFDGPRPTLENRARVTGNGPDENRALLYAVLTDAAGETVRAARNVTLSLEFSRALRDALGECPRSSSASLSRDRALAGLRLRSRPAEALAAQAVVRCIGSR